MVKTGKIPSFLHIVGYVLYFFGHKAAFVEILSMKTGLMHWTVDSPRDSFCFVDGRFVVRLVRYCAVSDVF